MTVHGDDECATCGHERREHIYYEDACRPGFTCPKGCVKFVAISRAAVPSEPTTPEAEPSFLVGDGEAKMEAALKPFGWKCGPVFWQRYYSDPWVFNLANAVERLSSERVEVGPSPEQIETYEVKLGQGIERTIAEMLTKANEEQVEVVAKFNDITLTARPGTVLVAACSVRAETEETNA